MTAVDVAAMHDVSVASSAWDVTAPSPAQLYGARSFVIAPARISRVFVDSFSEDLPCSGSWRNSSGEDLKRYELPAAGGFADPLSGGCVAETLRITSIPRRQSDRQCSAEISYQLPRLSRVAGIDGGPPVPEPNRPLQAANANGWQNASEVVEKLIDGHVDFVNQLFEGVPPSSPLTGRWQGRAGAVAVRSVADTAAHWEQLGRSDQPRMALIVRLAQELPDVLTQVCRHPRTVLRRERHFQSLGRVREVDSGCLRWLARQPGTTVAQKAGSRQQALAIVRVESIDTLENRVVRDLVIRAIQACQRYLREHRAAAAHVRIESVAKFRRLLGRLLKDGPIGGAAALVGVPQPNYVLQMEPRYHVLWTAYQQLVQQQRLEDNIWRWRQRLFAEHVQLGLVAAMQQLADPVRTHGGDALFQREQNAGQFFDSRSALGPWCLKDDPDSLVDLVRIDQLHLHSMIPESMAAIGPDIVLVKRSSNASQRFVGCWSVLDFDLGPVTYEDRVLSLQEALKRNAAYPHGRFLLFQPTLPSQASIDEGIAVDEIEQCRSLRVTLPLQQHVPRLVEQLRWALA